jgi:hypothetical protein
MRKPKRVEGAMTSGYYIAQWPAGTKVAHFLHHGLTFMGPFSSRREAEAVLAGTARPGL